MEALRVMDEDQRDGSGDGAGAADG
jgi:hypothetical protein